MVNPFHYPKAKHQRIHTPPVYQNYRQYKPELREEFSGQCVYCRALDRVKGQESFGVDHYRPKSLFPHLANEYLNLFYACNRCNSWKGRFWPSPGQRKNQIFVPNPCEHVMFQHLRYSNGAVMGSSTAGGFTIDLLDLNDPAAVEWRHSFSRALDLISVRIAEAKATITGVEKIRAGAKTPADKGYAEAHLERAQKNLQQLADVLKGLVG